MKRPIVVISGANKDVGKSSLATRIISRFPRCAAAKFTMHEDPPEGDPIIEEEDSEGGSDTSRMLRAGARPVFWVRATPETLPRLTGEVLEKTKDLPLVLEGNSVLELIPCDYAVFVMEKDLRGFKPSAWTALRHADSVLVNGPLPPAGEEAIRLEREIKGHNPRARIVFASERGSEEAVSIILSRIAGRLGGELFMGEVEERVAEALKERSEGGRIACAEALRLAEELGVPPLEVGKAANELGIKIIRCSLGCF